MSSRPPTNRGPDSARRLPAEAGADSPRRPATNRGAQAGALLLSPALLGAAVGLGIGSALGVPALLAIVGVFAGLIGGFFLVHARFRDL
jgi:hypothetical protein